METEHKENAENDVVQMMKSIVEGLKIIFE